MEITMAQRYNTGNQRPSNSMKDLNDNALANDDYMNSEADTFIDRLGDERDTLRGSTKKMLAAGAAVVEETRQNLIPLSRQYMTLAAAQADIANIPVGSTTYYRSPDDSALAVEVINNGGTLEATGRVMLSQEGVSNLINGYFRTLNAAGLIPEKLDPDTGYVFALRDPNTNKCALRISTSGAVEIPLLDAGTGVITLNNLSGEVTELIPSSLNPETGYVYGLIDPVTKRCAMRVSTSGQTEIPLLSLADNSVSRQSLNTDLQSLVPVTLNPETGYMFALADPVTKRCAMRISVNGLVEMPLFTVGEDTLSLSTLTPAARAAILPSRPDTVDSLPDPVRAVLTDVAARTNGRDGSAWSSFSARKCRALFGANKSGAALEFRRSAGLQFLGAARGGTFTPGAVASVNRRGRLTSQTISIPAGTYTAGDYYTYEANFPETTPGTWNGQSVYLGDNLVYDGAAWVIQRSPESGTVRVVDTWYQVTAAGVFSGIALEAGDKLLFLTNETSGGAWCSPKWSKVSVNGLCYGGEFSPSAGLPSAPAENTVWQASAAGVAGGETYAVGDYALYRGATWCRIENEAAVSVAAGSGISLRCLGSADEWEFRRADRAATVTGVRVSAQVSTVIRQMLGQKLLVIGDSMPGAGSPSVGDQIIAATGYAGETRSYGGSLSEQVLGMLKWEILNNGDNWQGQVMVAWHGQNNMSSSEALQAQIREVSLMMRRLTGTRDIRCLFLTVLGPRQMSWNGTRIVARHHEGQFDGTNIQYQLGEWYRLMLPGEYANTYNILLSAATDSIDPTFPGMTEKQVAAKYGVIPWSFFNRATLQGLTTDELVYKGTWTGSTLPTGGAHADYYIRTDGGDATCGNIIYNSGGVWIENNIDRIHLNAAGGAALTHGGNGFALGAGYTAITAQPGVADILMNNHFFK
ncbi:hypothetical protein [Klebsiella pneumoniae]|uniref:hypothetical protein n=1 Tax=Klebsiella pneumoniae TaxID=573 RepID=UPI0035567E77